MTKRGLVSEEDFQQGLEINAQHLEVSPEMLQQLAEQELQRQEEIKEK